MIDKGITYDQLLSDINALPSTPSADQLATYDLTGDGVLDAGDARYHIASQPLQQLSPLPPPQEGAEASLGLTPDQRLRAIMNQSGTGLSGGSLEDILNRGLQGDPLPLPDEQGLTPAPLPDQLPMDMPTTPNPNAPNRAPELGDGMYTTMAMGEEDGGNAGIGPDGNVLPGPGAPATTRMVGEEEGMDGFPGMATTLAMGEEDGGGTPMITTQAMGEEDGGNPFLPAPPPVGVNPPTNPFLPNPPIDIKPPVPLPRPPNPFLPAPPPVGGTAPLNPFPQLPTGGTEGRTYGNYQDQFPAEMLAQTSTAKGPFS